MEESRKSEVHSDTDKLLDVLKRFSEKRERVLSYSERMKCIARRQRIKRFLRGRKPVLVLCTDGVMRVVEPGMDIRLLGTNVIPLPCRYED